MPILNLEFTFNFLENPMHLVINNKMIVPDIHGKANYTTDISFPACIQLTISNKNKHDTVLDVDKNIIKDKCIILNKVSVDGIIPNINFIKKWPRISVNGTGSNQIVYSNYFGFNGIVELDFEGKNVFQWLLRTNKFRDNSWHQL